MDNESTAFIDEWPRVSFRAIAQEDVEGRALRIFYKSFFAVLQLPENILSTLSQTGKQAQIA